MSDTEVDDKVLRSRTGAGLIAFIEAKTDNYEITPASSGQMITAVRKALEVEPDGDRVDVLALSLDDLFERFRIKNPKLTDQSLAAYKSRFKRATTMYGKWLAGEDWKPTRTRKKAPSTKAGTGSGGTRTTTSEENSTSGSSETDEEKQTPPLDGEDTDDRDKAFTYRVYLVDAKMTVTVELPPTFSSRDAGKLTGLINALATEDAPASNG